VGDVLSDVIRRLADRVLRRWRALSFRTRELTGGGVAVAVLLAALAVAWEPGEEVSEPDRVVRAYLAAIRSGDVELALDLARQHPDGKAAHFLDTAGPGADWEIANVETTEDDGSSARVAVTLKAFGREQGGSFALEKSADGSWIMRDPLVRAGIGETPMRYLELGGAQATWGSADPAVGYLMFPGAYRAYPNGNALTAGPVEFFALNGSDPVIPIVPALTDAGADAARDAVAAYFGSCAARAELRLVGCPFSASFTTIDDRVGEEYLDDYRDIRWTVTKQPELEFAVEGPVVTVREVKPGEVELSMTATRQLWNGDDFDDGDDVDVRTTCRTRADTLVMTLEAGGTWKVVHVADVGEVSPEFAYRPAITADTCGGADN